MARKIIVLDQTGMPSDLRYNIAFWLDVPAARQPFFANATAITRVIGATVDELAAIRSGAIKEKVFEASYPVGTSLGFITNDLVSKYNADQADLNSATTNQWNRYGTFWDGTSWTSITVA